MRPVSPKRARTLARRRANVQAREHGRPACARQAICGNAADDLHEIVRRSQADSAARVDLQVWLCRGCHDWVGAHPAEAAAEGLHMTGATYRRRLSTVTAVDRPCIQTGMPATKLLQFRVTADGAAYVTKLVERFKVTPTIVLKAMFSVATGHGEEVLAKIRELAPPGPGEPEPAKPDRVSGGPVLKPSQGGRG